jgi:RNA polymerase sigma-70 factor (ECF subfamily)
MRTASLAQHDDSQHWREQLLRHGSALLLLARQWSATGADAEDAVQDGFVSFWRSRDRARDEIAYLFACVRTAAMELGRGQRRRGARTRAVSVIETSAFELPPVEQAERHATIEAALNQLPGDQREVIVMKIWGGLTFAQIGEALGTSPNTIASRYRYALTRLEAELSAEVRHD